MVDGIEYIAYEGECFTIEWYFNEKQESQALDYYRLLSKRHRIKVLQLFKRMGDAGVIKDVTKFRSEGDRVYAFKPKPDRFLCFFFEGRKIIVTHAFKKRRQKLPAGEKNKALENQKNYVTRVQRGEYYDG